jgi:hypothetical protein
VTSILSSPRAAGGDWQRQLRFDFEWSKRQILKAGGIAPTFLLHSETGRVEARVMSHWHPAQRPMVMEVIRLTCIAGGIVAVGSVAEAWVAPTDDMRPSEHPDRIEALGVMLMFRRDDALELLMTNGQLQRNAKGRVTAIGAMPDWYEARVAESSGDLGGGGFIPNFLREALTRDWTDLQREAAGELLIEMNQRVDQQETIH